jgi:aminoglycoside 3'-phosphotransferase-2
MAFKSSPILPALPPSLARKISSYEWRRDDLGRSAADIFRLVADGRPDLFLKIQVAGPFEEFRDEAARAEWLSTQGLPCPKVLALETHDGRQWLLSSAVPGRDLASSTELNPLQRVTILAEGLRRLHALEIDACPFDQRLARRLVVAAARVRANMVDQTDFDQERRSESASSLLDRLQRQQPAETDLVVVHGDASFPNVMAKDGQFSGFVDLSRLGVGDRYQDIALAAWSIRYNLGKEWVLPFFDAYGILIADHGKLGYYKALDEFF